MTGKIFRSCFLVGLAMMVLCTALFMVVMTNKHEQTVYAEMRQEMCYVRHGLEQSGKEYLTTLTGTQERLTWVAKDGTVLYDSVADPATMENHAARAEIRQAEQEGSGRPHLCAAGLPPGPADHEAHQQHRPGRPAGR